MNVKCTAPCRSFGGKQGSIIYWKRHDKSSKKVNVRTDFCSQDMQTKKREKNNRSNVSKHFEDLNTNVK